MEGQTNITKFNVVGGNIESCFGSKYAKIWLCTATSLDVVGNVPISIIDGKEMTNFDILTKEHALYASKCGPLKESIIKGFPDLIGLNVRVIQYYLKYIVPENGTFHVHVHRGSRMGTEHINQIKKRLGYIDPRLDFGFGYYLNELECKPCDVYYSISLIIGFDPKYSSGTTFIPNAYTSFTDPPKYNDKIEMVCENHLLTTIDNIEQTCIKNAKIARLSGIFVPLEEEIKIILF